MPITTKEIFNKVGLSPEQPVNWGVSIPCNKNGVYVIANDTCAQLGFNYSLINEWCSRDLYPNERKRNGREDDLKEYLKERLLSKEFILYIGKAEGKNGIRQRVGQFYSHVEKNAGFP